MRSDIYLKALEQYNRFLPQVEEDFVRSQQLFDYWILRLTNGSVDDYRHRRCKKLCIQLVNAVGWLMLAGISLISLLRCRIKRIHLAHYMIDIKNGQNHYDVRSKWILNYLPPSKSLNFLHTASPWRSLSSFHRKDNPFYFEAFYHLIKIFVSARPRAVRLGDIGVEQFYGKELGTAYVKYLIFLLLVKAAGIRDFLFLDDPRHTGELRLVCRNLHIHSTAYMHGRFNEFHVGIFHLSFDRYLVWSPYFADKLVSYGAGYAQKEVVVTGHPLVAMYYPIPERDNSKEIVVLWLGESNIDDSEVLPYIDALLLEEKIKLVFRGKPGNRATLYDYLKKNEISVDCSNTLFEAFDAHDVDVLLGTHSTGLMEGWIHGVPSVVVCCSYDYGRHLWEDGISKMCCDPTKIADSVRQEALLSPQEKQEKRAYVWGGDGGVLCQDVVFKSLQEYA